MEKLYQKVKFANKVEWLKARRIGGSSASALFNANPYMTSLDVYCAAINPNVNENEDDFDNESQKYGHDAEDIIRKLVKLNFQGQYKVQSPNGYTMYIRKDKPFMTATLDGILTNEVSGDKLILEIKTHDVRNKEDLAEWENHLPQNYFIQGLHYLAVMNDFVGVIYVAKLRFYDYFAEEGKKLEREEIRYYRVMRKDYEKDIELCEKVETHFNNHNIEKRIPPKITITL